MVPNLIFGTSTLGMDMTEFQDAESVKSLLGHLEELGIDRLNTAARCPPFKPGRSEQLLGEANESAANFLIDTKIDTDTSTDGSGDLTREAVEKSVNASFKRLRKYKGLRLTAGTQLANNPASLGQCVVRAPPRSGNAFGRADPGIERAGCQAALPGLGVSNFPPALSEKVLALCRKNGWEKPRYHQGAYSLITKGVESELLPILRAHNISFVGFQLLAAGFLTGKLVNNEHADTRLSDSNPLGKIVQHRFDAAVKAEGLTPTEVALRWVGYHSALGDGDAIILGASKTAQI
ncbi:Aflatoxin B1 aldehyde reductase member 2 [Cytospora mali]|uniref:Aflatoxin B1 aldehyde reductase member 2 n=1 Tax=Cytospora mali TaxID=578113 RepID=A0A194UNL5_CYTMA|nr:Aflatoxin B1 aldehyde reductase member 2 [Valsa mali var. pyri (nom. inval.)]